MSDVNNVNEINRTHVVEAMSSFHDVYIYGAGKEAKKLLNLLRYFEISVKNMVVSERNNNPAAVEDIPVCAISELDTDAFSTGAFWVGTGMEYRNEIVSTLKAAKAKHIFALGKEYWELCRTRQKLEITAKVGCKINCKYCPQSNFLNAYYKDDKERRGLMTLEDYKTCLSHVSKDTIICFAGFVEPFFHPQGVDMILYAHEQGFEIELYTTFMDLSYEDYLKIKDIPFKQVVLHTPDKNHYANITITDEYAKILNDALDHKRPNGDPFIDSANCQSEPSEEFLSLANGRIVVESALIDRAGNLDDSSLRSSGMKKGPIYCTRTEYLNHWVLLPDGSVTLCCMDFGLKHVMGNLIDHTYDEIIQMQPYQDLISGMNAQMSDILCRKCTSSRVR